MRVKWYSCYLDEDVELTNECRFTQPVSLIILLQTYTEFSAGAYMPYFSKQVHSEMTKLQCKLTADSERIFYSQ